MILFYNIVYVYVAKLGYLERPMNAVFVMNLNSMIRR